MGWEVKRYWVVFTLKKHSKCCPFSHSAQTWEEGRAGEVAVAGSPCRTCLWRCQVQAWLTASRESWMSPSLAVKPLFITSSPASYPAWLLLPCPPKPFPLSLTKRWAETFSCLFLFFLFFPSIGLCSCTSLWQSPPSVPLQTFSVSELLLLGMEVKIQLEMVKSTGLALSTPADLSSVRHEREIIKAFSHSA